MKAGDRLARDENLRNAIPEVEADRPMTWRRIDRRTFLKLTGIASGGLTLAACFNGDPAVEAPAAAATDFVPNAFINVGTDGTILIYSKIPEIGQGIKTSLPMIVAEELDADWADVRIEQAHIDTEVFGRQSAGGSRSTPTSWDQLREAGAAARLMLVRAAAATWGVPESECTTAPGAVEHAASGRSLSYGELADAAAGQPVPATAELVFKERGDYRLIGRRITGVDNEKIVRGEPLFGIDQRLPGMLYATYVKCPATGGEVRSANLDDIRALPGIRDAFVLEGNDTVTELMPGVAIVGDSTWAVFRARASLVVDWDERAAATDSWTELMAGAGRLAAAGDAPVLREAGNVDAAFASAARTVEAFYTCPFLSHAPLEPQNCTAWFRDGSIEIWAPTQRPDGGIASVARVLGIPVENIELHQLRVGGGFGRRLMNDYMCEVAAIAQRVDAPVKLQWTREDDMAHDFYRPGGFHSFKASLDESGRLSAWQDHFITFSHDGAEPAPSADMRPGEVPEGLVADWRIRQSLLPLGTPTGPWRAPRSNAIAFAVQSFIHELAVAANRDHVEFLLEIMGEPRELEPGNDRVLNTGRAADVIRLAAEKGGWGRQLPEGHGLGFAFYFSHAGHFAEVAEVSVDANRRLTVHRITVAGDVGLIINMSGAENQCQGAVIDGLSTMLGLEVTIEGGRVQEANFDRYPILRIDKAPAVDVHFIHSDFSPTGLGEPALPPLAPAVCNAIYAATGHRVRTLPLSREGFTA